MSTTPTDAQKFDELVNGLFFGTLTVAEQAALEQQLLADESQVKRYRELVALHVMLHATSATVPAEQLAMVDQIDVTAVLRETPVTLAESVRQQGSRKLQLSVRVLSIAVSLVLVGYFVGMAGLIGWDRLIRTRGGAVAVTKPTTAATDEPIVAKLVRDEQCQWAADMAIPVVNQPMGRRTCQLQSGTAEFEFADGARVIFEGPAEFEVQSASKGFLRRGQLVAMVPPQAVGFTVETPTVTVVDLGTEFGIAADEHGTTEVEVLKGKVELRTSGSSSSSSASEPSVQLSAGEAAKVRAVATGSPLAVERTARASGRFQSSPRLKVGGAIASSTYSQDFNVSNLVNGNGLQGDAHTNVLKDNMWFSAFDKVQGEYVLFDLTTPCRLDSLKVWNYNDGYRNRFLQRGVKQADIYVSQKSRGMPTDTDGDWQLVAADVKFDPATGKPEYDTPTIVRLKGVEARFVAIVIDDSIGRDPGGQGAEPEGVGLSEVQFFGKQIRHSVGK